MSFCRRIRPVPCHSASAPDLPTGPMHAGRGVGEHRRARQLMVQGGRTVLRGSDAGADPWPTPRPRPGAPEPRARGWGVGSRRGGRGAPRPGGAQGTQGQSQGSAASWRRQEELLGPRPWDSGSDGSRARTHTHVPAGRSAHAQTSTRAPTHRASEFIHSLILSFVYSFIRLFIQQRLTQALLDVSTGDRTVAGPIYPDKADRD